MARRFATEAARKVFTVMAWIKAEIPRRRAAIVARGEDNVTGNDPWKIVLQTDGTFILMLEDANDVNATYSSATFVADDDWHHVAATRQQSGAVATYVDGVPRVSFAASIVPSSANSQFLTIGCTHGIFGPPPPPPVPAWFFPGQIDEPAVWNRALTAQEIVQAYELSATGPSPAVAPTVSAHCARYATRGPTEKASTALRAASSAPRWCS